mmetsp:Transcript_22205/g.63554  ORF Transcript_22205/g.63554 Transcript_22205/m.63554 type:complete len:91 (+) Transcript_22205:1158-1430(+)
MESPLLRSRSVAAPEIWRPRRTLLYERLGVMLDLPVEALACIEVRSDRMAPRVQGVRHVGPEGAGAEPGGARLFRMLEIERSFDWRPEGM